MARWISTVAALAIPCVLAIACGDDDPPAGGAAATDGGPGDGADKADAERNGNATSIAEGNPFSHGVWSPSLTTDGTWVYWIEGGRTDAASGKVRRAKSDGSSAAETFADAQAQPVAIAATVDGVVWANGGTKEIVTLRTGAKEPVVLGTASGKPNALTVDASDVWWVQSAPPAVARIRADPAENGQPFVVAPVPGAGQLGQLALFNGDVYFTDLNQDGNFVGAVQKASAGGGGVLVTIAVDQPEPTGIVSNETAVVWANQGTLPAFADGSILRVLDDGSTSIVAADRHNPGFVVADATHAYWLEGAPEAEGRVAKASLAGGEVTIVAEVSKATSNLAADATHLYWAANGRIWRAPK